MEKKSKKNAIAIVVNQSFVHYVGPLINSIKENWVNHPDILLFLHHEVKEKYVRKYKKKEGVLVKIFVPKNFEYRKYLKDVGGRFSSKSFNDTGFFVINFWSNLVDNYNDILFLDADMLVLKNLYSLMKDNNFFRVSAANPKIFPLLNYHSEET